MIVFSAIKSLPFVFANHCDGNIFFGFPHWWKYLDVGHDSIGNCQVNFIFPGDIWAVVFAVIDMLLYLAGVVAVVMIIVSGVMYIMSSGDVEKAADARRRIVNSLVGLAIVLIAAATVSFIARSIL